MPKSTRRPRSKTVKPDAVERVERVAPPGERVERDVRTERVSPSDPGVTVAPDGRMQPDDGVERASTLPKDTDERDNTVSGPAAGTVVGAGLGAVVGGPVGAVVGAVAGAAAGKLAEEANREDPNVPTGNPTDADSHRVRNDYFAGQIYEEGSLADVPIKRGRDLHPGGEADASGPGSPLAQEPRPNPPPPRD